MELSLDPRQERGLLISQSPKLKQVVEGTWFVPSQSQAGGYLVDVSKHSCTCPDHELMGDTSTCKHRWAVHFRQLQSKTSMLNTDPQTVDAPSAKRPTYAQPWSNYNAAQTNEKDEFLRLLKSLCDGVENPQSGLGRPRAALADVIFAATLKVFVGMSGRRATSDVRDSFAKGYLDSVPSYNTVFSYMQRPEVTPILKGLVRRSALPLAMVESKFAIDSTGFSSCVYDRWYDAKYGKTREKATWVKLHAVCGVKTHIITAVEVTDSNTADSPLLPQLARETAANFVMEALSADKGYLSFKNFEAINALGAEPLIAFKDNSKFGDDPLWNKAFHLFSLHRNEWLPKYHVRSNIETVFSAMQKKFGKSVKARLPDAQLNEVLLKCLAHNLSCLVHAMYELGIKPDFTGVAK